jgi:hypothetical protein
MIEWAKFFFDWAVVALLVTPAIGFAISYGGSDAAGRRR